jgi:hypothetical protein
MFKYLKLNKNGEFDLAAFIIFILLILIISLVQFEQVGMLTMRVPHLNWVKKTHM